MRMGWNNGRTTRKDNAAGTGNRRSRGIIRDTEVEVIIKLMRDVIEIKECCLTLINVYNKQKTWQTGFYQPGNPKYVL